MYDLHTHTIFSDGVLVPAESVRRAKASGYKGLAITDHADASNYLMLVENLLLFKESYNKNSDDFKVIIGVEFTHILPKEMGKLVLGAKKVGADIIIVHGETIVEPVERYTNRAAIESNVDILAHPGLITDEDSQLAAKNGVFLEITTRKGHCYTNAHVAIQAKSFGVNLVVNNDFHAPSDFLSKDMIKKIMSGAGLSNHEIERTFDNNKRLFLNKLEDKNGKEEA